MDTFTSWTIEDDIITPLNMCDLLFNNKTCVLKHFEKSIHYFVLSEVIFTMKRKPLM